MSYARLAERLFNVPLLIAPDKAETIAAVFNAHLQNTVAELPKFEPPPRVDLATSMSMRRADGGYYVTNAGVGVVQAHGSFVQRAGGLDALSGLAGYNSIASTLSAAVRDVSVRGVVMEFDSPGGEVEGVVDLSSLIAGADKPVWAHANGIALSAAYWLSASADRVYASQTGLLGSIGVLMLHADRSKIIERVGVVYTPIYAGAHKIDGSSMAPLSEGARARAQARVDQVYDMFVEHVAAHRNVSAKKVRETEAAILSVQDAKQIGLANGVASLGDTVQMLTDDLNAGRSKRKSYGRAAALAQLPEEHDMTQAANGAAPVPAVITQEQLDAAKAAGIAEGRAAAKVDAEDVAKLAAKEAEVKAKARIKAIESCDAAKDRPALAKKVALDTDMTPEAAQEFMAALPKEAKTGSLAASMPPNPKVGADGEPKDSGAGVPLETSEEIFSRRRAQMQSVK